MNTTLAVTNETLRRDNRRWRGSGGVSENAREGGFLPAFQDLETGRTYLAQYADGTLAPMHLLDGLPADVVLRRDAVGRTTAVKRSIISGFVHCGRFYTREQSAAHCASALD